MEQLRHEFQVYNQTQQEVIDYLQCSNSKTKFLKK